MEGMDGAVDIEELLGYPLMKKDDFCAETWNELENGYIIFPDLIKRKGS